jgi:hypothetical protein
LVELTDMAYDITNKVIQRRDQAEARLQVEIEDEARLAFLRRLNDAQDINVTDWEAQFAADLTDHPRSLTPRQRECVDKMRKEYEHRLPSESRVKLRTPSSELRTPIARTAAGGCQYVVKSDAGQLIECGQPAVLVSGRGLEYCQIHADVCREACARKKIPITFRPLTHERPANHP